MIPGTYLVLLLVNIFSVVYNGNFTSNFFSKDALTWTLLGPSLE
jgi:hypothetical protein